MLGLAVLCALAVGEARSRTLAAEKWPTERTAGPVLCHADFSLDAHKKLLAEIESLQQDVATILGTQEPRETMHLFLFEKPETYETYMKRYFPRVPARRALYIKGRGPGMVFAHQGTDFEIDVRHESTHALLHASFETVPLWLDEGIAEYFEVPRDKRASENPHLATIRALLRQGSSPRLEALEEISGAVALIDGAAVGLVAAGSSTGGQGRQAGRHGHQKAQRADTLK